MSGDPQLSFQQPFLLGTGMSSAALYFAFLDFAGGQKLCIRADETQVCLCKSRFLFNLTSDYFLNKGREGKDLECSEVGL